MDGIVYLRPLYSMTIDIALLLELLAAAIALAGVLLTSLKRLAGWTLGVIGSCFYGWIFFDASLYAEALLQGFYALMGIYGWMKWNRERSEDLRKARHIGKAKAFQTLVWIVALTIPIGFFLDQYSDSPAPWIDAGLAAAGLLITLLMAERFVENWIAWVVVDLISAALYYDRNLMITAGLYVLFSLFAGYGYVRWRKELLQP